MTGLHKLVAFSVAFTCASSLAAIGAVTDHVELLSGGLSLAGVAMGIVMRNGGGWIGQRTNGNSNGANR